MTVNAARVAASCMALLLFLSELASAGGAMEGPGVDLSKLKSPILLRGDDRTAFRDPAEFRIDMDQLLLELKTANPAEGAERVYFAGQKEFEHEDESASLGVPLLRKTYEGICKIGQEHGVEQLPLSVRTE